MSEPMLKRLLGRLDDLAEVLAQVHARAAGRDAQKLDGLATARLLVAVDLATKRLGKLADALGLEGMRDE
jgi:hypothetical protein